MGTAIVKKNQVLRTTNTPTANQNRSYCDIAESHAAEFRLFSIRPHRALNASECLPSPSLCVPELMPASSLLRVPFSCVGCERIGCPVCAPSTCHAFERSGNQSSLVFEPACVSLDNWKNLIEIEIEIHF